MKVSRSLNLAAWMALTVMFVLPPMGYLLELWRLDVGAGVNAVFASRRTEGAIGFLVLWGACGLATGIAAVHQFKLMLDERAVALAQSDFVSAVSHEMRTPLTTIKLYAEMLREGVVSEPAARDQYLQTIALECDRLHRLVENVLDFSSVTGRRKAYRFEPLLVRPLIDEAIAATRSQIEAAGLQVDIEAPVSLAAAVDRDAIIQALINLIGNAVKYAPEGQRIRVTARQEGRSIVLGVQDHGPGIPKAEQDKIFQAFYRAGSELTRTVPGTGLGLALVAETAKAHQGKVALRSVPGEGSTFSLVIPQERSHS